MKKAKAMKVRAEEPRSTAKQKELDRAVQQTEHNAELFREVVAGRKGRAAMMYEDEGGEFKRVGYPPGHDFTKSVRAHERLFGKRDQAAPAQPSAPSAPAEKRGRGRPRGAVTRGNTEFKGQRVLMVVPENPKRAGSQSAARFALYRVGMTTEEFIEAGGTVGDLRWDVAHDFIKLGT